MPTVEPGTPLELLSLLQWRARPDDDDQATKNETSHHRPAAGPALSLDQASMGPAPANERRHTGSRVGRRPPPPAIGARAAHGHASGLNGGWKRRPRSATSPRGRWHESLGRVRDPR